MKENGGSERLYWRHESKRLTKNMALNTKLWTMTLNAKIKIWWLWRPTWSMALNTKLREYDDGFERLKLMKEMTLNA